MTRLQLCAAALLSSWPLMPAVAGAGCGGGSGGAGGLDEGPGGGGGGAGTDDLDGKLEVSATPSSAEVGQQLYLEIKLTHDDGDSGSGAGLVEVGLVCISASGGGVSPKLGDPGLSFVAGDAATKELAAVAGNAATPCDGYVHYSYNAADPDPGVGNGALSAVQTWEATCKEAGTVEIEVAAVFNWSDALDTIPLPRNQKLTLECTKPMVTPAAIPDVDVYVLNDDTQDIEHWLVTEEAATFQSTVPTSSPQTWPIISPTLGFIWAQGGGAGFDNREVFARDAATGALTPAGMTIVAPGNEPSVSPDGKIFAAQKAFEGFVHTFAVDPATGVLTAAPGSPVDGCGTGNAFAASWSVWTPDSKQLVQACDDDTADVYAVAPSGALTHQASSSLFAMQDDYGVHSIALSKSGTELVIGAEHGMFLATVGAGGVITALPPGATKDYYPADWVHTVGSGCAVALSDGKVKTYAITPNDISEQQSVSAMHEQLSVAPARRTSIDDPVVIAATHDTQSSAVQLLVIETRACTVSEHPQSPITINNQEPLVPGPRGVVIAPRR